MSHVVPDVEASSIPVNHCEISPQVFCQRLFNPIVCQYIVHVFRVRNALLILDRFPGRDSESSGKVPQDKLDLRHYYVHGFHEIILLVLTSPSFCTTANERVYITTSSVKGANGGSQGAVGDRRAAICGANAAGAGGL